MQIELHTFCNLCCQQFWINTTTEHIVCLHKSQQMFPIFHGKSIKMIEFQIRSILGRFSTGKLITFSSHFLFHLASCQRSSMRSTHSCNLCYDHDLGRVCAVVWVWNVRVNVLVRWERDRLPPSIYSLELCEFSSFSILTSTRSDIRVKFNQNIY